jgi:hypothetical protein
MKILFKILKFLAAFILLLLLILANETPALIVTGKTGFARSQGLNIWYESIYPKQPPKGAVLLIMGISSDALAWPEKFILKIPHCRLFHRASLLT